MHEPAAKVEEARRLVQQLVPLHGVEAVDRVRAERPDLGAALDSYLRQLDAVVDDHLRAAIQHPAPELLPGEKLGKYVIRAKIGAGGQGAVYRAWDPSLQRAVAIKAMLSLAGEHEYDEGRLLAALKHPGIVKVFDVGVSPGWFLVMELLDNHSLQDSIATAGPLDLARVARLGEQVADALHAAHLVPVLHCDVKPSNILLDQAGQPTLVDFGIARRLGVFAPAAAGTPQYMAPEQVAGGQLTPATDVFGLGATLFHALTGRPPFLDHHDRRDARRSARALRRAVPKDLDAIIVKATQPEPHARYASAAAMRDDLRRFLDGVPVSARPVPLVLRGAMLARRHPRTTTAVGLVGAAALLAGIWLDVQQRAASAKVAAANAKVADEQRAANARASFDAGQLAARWGRWREALAYYDRAQAAGYADAEALAIGRAEAHLGRSDGAMAREALASLPADPATRRSGKFLLLEGMLASRRWVQPEAGLDRIQQALDRGDLGPADESIARAFLSTRILETRDHLAKAAHADPSNPCATYQLAFVHLLLGDPEQAQLAIRTYRTVYPESPVGMLLQAMLFCLQARTADAKRELAPLLALGDPVARVLGTVIDALDTLALADSGGLGLGDPLDWAVRSEPASPNLPPASTPWTLEERLRALVALAARGLPALLLPSTKSAFDMSLPPACIRMFKRALNVFPAWDILAGRDPAELATALVARLEPLLEEAPIAGLYLVRASALSQIGRVAESEADCERALELPAWLPAQRSATLGLLLSVQRSAAAGLGALADPALSVRAQRARARALEFDRAGPQLYDLAFRNALIFGARGDAAAAADAADIAHRWAALQPAAVEPLAAVAAAEYFCGAYGPALLAADAVLARDSRHAGAKALRDLALAKLGRIGQPRTCLSVEEYQAQQTGNVNPSDPPPPNRPK